MANILKTLEQKQLINLPKFVVEGCQYLVHMGSDAYGVSSNSSDIDLYGFCIPPKSYIFPHLTGEIEGFGQQNPRFGQWQEHHIKNPDSEKEYDCSIYNIIKYFQLCSENNPNMIDSLFVPVRSVLFSTKIGDMVRDSRKSFLTKESWFKFKGYAYSQKSKIRVKADNGTLPKNEKRAESVLSIGYDSKFLYHLIRLILEIEQILGEGDLDLERNRELLKSIRRGEWTLEQGEEYFFNKEKQLEQVYTDCKLPETRKDTEPVLKQLLMNCLEEYYGSLEDCIVVPNAEKLLLQQIYELLDKNRRSFNK